MKTYQIYLCHILVDNSGCFTFWVIFFPNNLLQSDAFTVRYCSFRPTEIIIFKCPRPNWFQQGNCFFITYSPSLFHSESNTILKVKRGYQRGYKHAMLNHFVFFLFWFFYVLWQSQCSKSYIRHEDFRLFVRPSVRDAHGTPPWFWNGVDWRALVKY